MCTEWRLDGLKVGAGVWLAGWVLMFSPIVLLHSTCAGKAEHRDAPVIEFTDVPPYGSYQDLKGRVLNVNPPDYRVVVYIHVPDAGWWIKPTAASPLTNIQNDGTWTCDITTGGNDQNAIQIAAYLVPAGYQPPIVTGAATLPDELTQHSAASTTATRGPVINFSEYQWMVKSGASPMGPGPNYFSDSADNVWVDNQGRLHLRITYREGRWYCAEVISLRTLGYGTYRFYLDSPVDNLDPNAVFAPFTWSDADPYNHREIDIEFSQWSGTTAPNNSQYVIQPWDTPDNMLRFQWPANIAQSTHSFHWKPESVHFLSVRGHYATPPDTSHVIKEWTCSASDVPPTGDEKTHINLWLYNGAAPNSAVEVIVSKFEFIPEGGNPAPTVSNITPNSGVNNGSANISNLAGTGFQQGATVKLSRSGQSDIPATNVAVVSDGNITCTFDLDGKATGQWDVGVTNPDSQNGTLANGFTINAASTVTHDVALTSFTASPTTAARGQRVVFSFTVENNGDVTEVNVVFRLAYNGQVLGQPKTIASLGAGQQTSGTMKVKIPRRQRAGDYLIAGTVSTIPGETNTTNNSQTVKVTVK
ncbi:MAG: hypothetical protein GW893_20750 [Armatimonadetes bacterium]|nr:hypothetical protein [Armatimonadota bacterium]